MAVSNLLPVKDKERVFSLELIQLMDERFKRERETRQLQRDDELTASKEFLSLNDSEDFFFKEKYAHTIPSLKRKGKSIDIRIG